MILFTKGSGTPDVPTAPLSKSLGYPVSKLAKLRLVHTFMQKVTYVTPPVKPHFILWDLLMVFAIVQTLPFGRIWDIPLLITTKLFLWQGESESASLLCKPPFLIMCGIKCSLPGVDCSFPLSEDIVCSSLFSGPSQSQGEAFLTYAGYT